MAKQEHQKEIDRIIDSSIYRGKNDGSENFLERGYEKERIKANYNVTKPITSSRERSDEIKKGEYKFKIQWLSEQPYNPECEAIDVRIEQNGREYSVNFVTLKFLQKMFEKNKRTGECANGAYFTMRGMIVVERIEEETIKASLDDMIDNAELQEYLEQIR